MNPMRHALFPCCALLLLSLATVSVRGSDALEWTLTASAGPYRHRDVWAHVQLPETASPIDVETVEVIEITDSDRPSTAPCRLVGRTLYFQLTGRTQPLTQRIYRLRYQHGESETHQTAPIGLNLVTNGSFEQPPQDGDGNPLQQPDVARIASLNLAPQTTLQCTEVGEAATDAFEVEAGGQYRLRCRAAHHDNARVMLEFLDEQHQSCGRWQAYPSKPKPALLSTAPAAPQQARYARVRLIVDQTPDAAVTVDDLTVVRPIAPPGWYYVYHPRDPAMTLRWTRKAASDGRHAVRITSHATRGTARISTSAIKLRPNMAYRIDADVMVHEPAAVAVSVIGYDAEGNRATDDWKIASVGPDRNLFDEWQPLTKDFVTPPNIATVRVRLSVGWGAGSATFDNVRLIEKVGAPIEVVIKPVKVETP